MCAKHAQRDSALNRLLDAVRRRLLARRMLALASRNVLVVLAVVAGPAVLANLCGGLHSSFIIHHSSFISVAIALCAAALAAAVVQAILGRPARIDAAIYLDRRLRLHERLASLISASPDGPMYGALRADALTCVRHISAAVACPISIPRSAPVTAAVAFAVAGLVFGPAQSGSAGKQLPLRNEVEDIMSAAYVRVELSPGLQQDLTDAAGAECDDLDEAAARLDDLLGQLDAFDSITAALEPLDPHMANPESIEDLFAKAPGARSRIQAALAAAAKALESDPALKDALDKTLAAIAAKSDADLAGSLAALLDQLAAKAAGKNVDRLRRLRTELAELKKSAQDEPGYKEGVTRVLLSDSGRSPAGAGDAGDESAPAHFPPDALLRARAAVDSGSIPASYRWVVERYFAQKADGEDDGMKR